GGPVSRLTGARGRLRDVHEALAGWGLGPDAFAVIRQGQVEAICASRPSERRAMLEEAAGVGAPKRRRRRAGQKLVRVAERLDRARDIAAEVASRTRSLERQARAAERAGALEAELESVRCALGASRAWAAASALSEARARR